MKITRDVISDLLPAYISGEATADTRALVEEMALSDPDIGRLVESARQERSVPMLHEPVSLPPNLERETVARTRAMIYRRSWVLALALFFTFLPFTMRFYDGTVTFLALRDQPAFRIFWVVAAFFWFDYILLGRRLRVS